MTPSIQLIIGLLVITLLSMAVTINADFLIFWYGMVGLFLIAILIDFFLSLHLQPPQTKRHINTSMAVTEWQNITLQLYNPNHQTIKIHVFDHLPTPCESTGLPSQNRLTQHMNTTIEYCYRPLKRGIADFRSCQVIMGSPWRFWLISTKISVSNRVKIYPNYRNAINYSLLVTGHHLGMIGRLKLPRRGVGQSFHQLREYQEGDSLKQIDWKTTARLNRLISKDYQDERDQEILLLLDCGHRMIAQENNTSHLDHCLNAALLLAYVGLGQGDAVGIATFGGVKRWQTPRKGLSYLSKILNIIYDIQPSLESPDYIDAALSLMRLQHKRTLIIIITNLRDEESDDLLTAIQLISQRHLVLIASLQEQSVQQLLSQSPTKLNQALQVAGAHEYLYKRKQLISRLQHQGIPIVDTSPSDLGMSLVNHYFRLKSSGKW